MLKPRFYYTDPMYESEVKMLFLDDKTPVAYKKPMNKLAFPRLTICGIWDTDKNTMSYGVAKCCFKDRFEKKVGRRLAYNRALEDPIRVIKISDIKNVSTTFIEEAQNIEYEHYAKLVDKMSYNYRQFA